MIAACTCSKADARVRVSVPQQAMRQESKWSFMDVMVRGVCGRAEGGGQEEGGG